MDTQDKSSYPADPLGPEHAAEEHRLARARTRAGIAFIAIMCALTTVARCNAIDDYKPPKFVCTTTVDTGETLWGIAGQVAGSDPAAINATRHDIAFNNGHPDSAHLAPGTKLGLTLEECRQMKESHPDQVTS